MNRYIETELIDRCLEGDQLAFTEIYLRLKDPIFGFVLRMTGVRHVAEEITQEVFLLFIEKSSSFDPGRSGLYVYLCGIARNKTLNYLRRHHVRKETNEIPESNASAGTASSVSSSPLESLMDKEFKELVFREVLKLTDLQREVVLLRETQELSYSEIAEVVKTDIPTVKGRLFRARKKLVAALTQYAESGEVENI